MVFFVSVFFVVALLFCLFVFNLLQQAPKIGLLYVVWQSVRVQFAHAAACDFIFHFLKMIIMALIPSGIWGFNTSCHRMQNPGSGDAVVPRSLY